MARLLFFALLLAPLAVRAQPMQPDAAPASETLRLNAGDEGSASFDVRAEAESGMEGCPGYVDPSAPDVAVEWGGGDLRFWVRASFDATLLVSGPDGEWACNDDTEGTSPVVEVIGAPAGRYAVWLGSFAPDPVEMTATLYAGAPPPPPVLSIDTEPSVGVVTAVGGFEEAQGAIEVNVQAGGPDRADALDVDEDLFCNGFIDADQPTAAVEYTADGGTGVLVLSGSSFDTDLVLLVRGPDGMIWCNDDFQGSDPLVEVIDAESGRYLAWVGTFNAEREMVPATFIVSETALDDPYLDGGMEPLPFSEGTYTALDLSAEPPREMTLDGDEVSVETSVVTETANPVQGDACAGSIETTPTVGLSIRGEGPVAITATSDVDLTLVLLTPDGTWYCSDDAYDLDPGVQIDEPVVGTYKIWVGTFGGFEEAVGVTVAATRGALEISTPSYGPEPMEVPSQEQGMYDGTEIQSGDPAYRPSAEETLTVRAGGPVQNPVEGDVCSGFISERPTAEFEGGFSAEVSASADADLTLVLLTPDGTWYCSDDAEGTDPRIQVYGHPEGTYSVWVGTFSRLSRQPDATLTVGPAPTVED